MQRKLKPLDLAAFQDAYQRSRAILRAGTFTDPRGRVMPLAVRRSGVKVEREPKDPRGTWDAPGMQD